jgi:hypothetical protein
MKKEIYKHTRLFVDKPNVLIKTIQNTKTIKN